MLEENGATTETREMIEKYPHLVSKRRRTDTRVVEHYKEEVSTRCVVTTDLLQQVFEMKRTCPICKKRTNITISKTQSSTQLTITGKCPTCVGGEEVVEEKEMGGGSPFAKWKKTDFDLILARVCFSPYNSPVDRVCAVLGAVVFQPQKMRLFYEKACEALQELYEEHSERFCQFQNTFQRAARLLTDVQWSHPQKSGKRAPNAVATGLRYVVLVSLRGIFETKKKNSFFQCLFVIIIFF